MRTIYTCKWFYTQRWLKYKLCGVLQRIFSKISKLDQKFARPAMMPKWDANWKSGRLMITSPPPFLGPLLKLSKEEFCHFNHKSVKYVYVKGSPPKRKHQKSAKITVQNVLQSIFLHCWEQFDDMCGPWEIRADKPRCTHQVHDCRRVTLYTEPGMDKFSRE